MTPAPLWAVPGQRLSLVAPAVYGKKSNSPDWRTSEANPIRAFQAQPWARPPRRSSHAKHVCLRVALKTRHRRCRISGLCARLRTIGEAGAQVNNLVHSCTYQVDFAGKDPYLPVVGRHKKPVRTQCLTSAARCLCPHPNSLALLSPIPKLASAARPPATRHSSTGNPPIPLTLRHLNLARCPPPGVLGSAPACGRLRALPLISRRATRFPPNPPKKAE